MLSVSTAPEDVRDFLNDIKEDSLLRWLGPSDSVHIDDGLNLRNRKEWEEKYLSLQSKL